MSSEKGSTCIQDNFVDRQKQLDKQLCMIEKSLNKHNNHTGSRVPRLEDLSATSQSRNKIRGFRGRQSLFKRPEGPAPRSNILTIPDYRRNPKKWTCYSLDDVSEMSNESNSKAAFSFLDELKQRKRREPKTTDDRIRKKLRAHREIMDVDAGTSQADDDMEMEERFIPDDKTVISFKKPEKREESFKLDPKPEFRNNKIIMPEYEVGAKKIQKKKELQKRTSGRIDKRREMKLDHLDEQEDDED